MQVTITRDRSKAILELIDDSLLQRRDSIVDDEVEYTQIVEYCLKDCSGVAHLTGQPDSVSHFCNFHVHRSADCRLKKNVFADSYAGSFVHF